MKVKIAVALVTFFVIISACKKSALFSGSKIATLTNYSPVGGGYKETFTYNSDGRVATMVRNDGIKQAVYYSGDTVTVATLNGLGQTTDAVEYVLNGSGYAVSSQGEFVSQHNSGTYSYDGNGMWTQVNSYVNHTLTNTDNYTNNSAKNAVEIQHVSPTNGTSYDYYNFYTSNGNTIGVQNMGEYYLGVSSANLISTDVKIATNGDTSDIISYRYRYDGSSNVDTMVSYNRAGHLVDSITYTYY